MKKRKIIPAILLLVLCFAVLGVGVYSAGLVGVNRITAKLNINASGYEVEIAVYKDEVLPANRIGYSASSRVSSEIPLDDTLDNNVEGIDFYTDEANAASDVPVLDFIIAIKNKSDSPIGVYFWNKGSSQLPPEHATVSDILYSEHNLDGADGDLNPYANIVTADYSFYHEVKGKENNTETTVYMHVRLSLNELVTNDVTVNLEMYLNVEAYNPDVAASAEHPFVKLGTESSLYTSLENNTNVTNVVIPHSVTSIASSSFKGCSALTYVNIPEHVTSIGSEAFDNCSTLSKIVVETSDLASSYQLPLKANYHWEKNGTTVTSIPAGSTAVGTYKLVAD